MNLNGAKMNCNTLKVNDEDRDIQALLIAAE